MLKLKSLGLCLVGFSLSAGLSYATSDDNTDTAHHHHHHHHTNPDPTSEVRSSLEKNQSAIPSAVMPKGKTLPKHVLRAIVGGAAITGDSGFNASGARTQSGFTYKGYSMGFGAEYGLTNRVSVGLRLPYRVDQSLTMNKQKFQSSQIFRDNVAEVQALATVILTDLGMCGGATGVPCSAAMAAVQTSEQTFTDPLTGEQLVVPADTTINQAIDAAVINAATPAAGSNGIGDLEVGVLWNVFSEQTRLRHVPLYLSFGAGLRMPTGKFDVISAHGSTSLPTGRIPTGGDGSATGGGTYDLGIKIVLDYSLFKGVYLSWEHMVGKSLTNAKITRSSYLHPGVANKESSVNNTQTFSRRGYSNTGYVELQWGLGDVLSCLKMVGLSSAYKYNTSAGAYIDGQALTPTREVQTSWENTITLSGLPYHFPLEFVAGYEVPVTGKNKVVAPQIITTQLRAYVLL